MYCIEGCLLFSVELVVIFCAILVIGCYVLSVRIAKKSVLFHRYKIAVLVVMPCLLLGLYGLLAKPVYILKEQNGGYDKRLLFFPSQFTLTNGQQLALTPKAGIASIVVNDTKYNAVFETVTYGQAEAKPIILLPAQSITYVSSSTDYILNEPPISFASNASMTKGWIHF